MSFFSVENETLSLSSLNRVSRFILNVQISRTPIDLFHLFAVFLSCNHLSLPLWLSRLCTKIVCGSNLKFRMISKVFLDWRELAFLRNLRVLVI